jgi:hypothetical protein
MKDQWMSQINMNDFQSLDELRSSLLYFVNTYNDTIHSSLNGLTPHELFFSESHMIKRLPPEQIQHSFLLEQARRVSADSVIVIDEIHYEVDYRFAKQKIILRHSPDLKEVFVVEPITEMLEPIKLLNKNVNAHIKREKIRYTQEV